MLFVATTVCTQTYVPLTTIELDATPSLADLGTSPEEALVAGSELSNKFGEERDLHVDELRQKHGDRYKLLQFATQGEP